MRTIRTKVYQFNELSEDAKIVAIEKNSLINVDFDWWLFTYEDAERIGLKLTGFDLDRNKHADGNFEFSANEVAQNIFSEHGEDCETYKTALRFMEVWEPIFAEYFETENVEFEDKLLELEKEFLKDILSDYADILQNEYEYLQSYEAIKETLISNEYEFTKEGILFN